MKKFLSAAVFALYLASCGGPVTLSYSVEFTTDDTGRMADLTLALNRVVQRRLARLEGALLDYDVEYDEGSGATSIAMKVDNAKAAEALNEELVAPFMFEVRFLAEDEQEGDILVEGTGNFRATGVMKEDVDWVFGKAMEDGSNSSIVAVGFTDAGIEKMKALFREQTENTLGLFVRGRLAAAMQVPEDVEFERTITIPGLPSADLAEIFADDVNVGIHMTFHPVQ